MLIDKKIYEQYRPTIGIECHVQLATNTKLFSGANNDARDEVPNSVISAVDYGLPGMLPVLNKRAVELAVRAGLALNSEILLTSRFDRKHYFYPDLPKGYQISQLYHPIIGVGSIEVPLPNGESMKVRINHAHLEEDAGKLTHPNGADYSLVDLNRAGTPLIEIVSEADIHGAVEAKAFAQELYLLMTYADVTRGDLYHGNMRFDVNISVAKKDAKKWGKRAEIKNLNSFRAIEKVVEYEFKRQVELLERQEVIIQETRGWDDAKQKTFSQRSKEEAQDYRYMPDPDIPPVVLMQHYVDKIRQQLPVLPQVYRSAWQALNLDESVKGALLSNKNTAQLILSVQNTVGGIIAKRIANWFASAVESNDERIIDLNQEQLVDLARMVDEGELNSTAAKEIFNDIIDGSNMTAREIAENKDLLQVSNENEITRIVEEVLADPSSAKAIADIKNGNDKAVGFLVGQIMKKSQGKANPGLAQKLIIERL